MVKQQNGGKLPKVKRWAQPEPEPEAETYADAEEWWQLDSGLEGRDVEMDFDFEKRDAGIDWDALETELLRREVPQTSW